MKIDHMENVAVIERYFHLFCDTNQVPKRSRLILWRAFTCGFESCFETFLELAAIGDFRFTKATIEKIKNELHTKIGDSL